MDQEFRFRIASTYAVADDSSVISTQSLVVSQGLICLLCTINARLGGSVALNESYLTLQKIVNKVSNEVLLLEVAKPPRHGYLEWLDEGRGSLSVSEFQRGSTVIYRHLVRSRVHFFCMINDWQSILKDKKLRLYKRQLNK